ncbi:suhB [Symbiodinium sp. KB8]|nr:suhB [Symbiodinium sp. KB8]
MDFADLVVVAVQDASYAADYDLSASGKKMGYRRQSGRILCLANRTLLDTLEGDLYPIEWRKAFPYHSFSSEHARAVLHGLYEETGKLNSVEWIVASQAPVNEDAVEVLAYASELVVATGQRLREEPGLNWKKVLETGLREMLPDHESGRGHPSHSSWTWVTGNSDYLPEEAILVLFASSLEGEAIAVVFDPWRDELFTAMKQHGAELNGMPLSGRHRSGRLRDVIIGTEALGDPRRSLQSLRGLYYAGPPRSAGVRVFPSAALGLAWVACGRLGTFVAAPGAELAAGQLLVSESGGVLRTDSPGGWTLSAQSDQLLSELRVMLSEADAI